MSAAASLLLSVLAFFLIPSDEREPFIGDLSESDRPLLELLRSAPALLRLRLGRTLTRRLPVVVGGVAGITLWLVPTEMLRHYVLSQVPLRADRAPSLPYSIASGLTAFLCGAAGGWLIARLSHKEIR
jgi:hypothetical protein